MAGGPEQAASMDRLLGIEYIDDDPERAQARFAVGPRVLQPYGIVHGGAYATLAESLCSRATYLAVKDDGMVAMGQANQATFLRPVTEGHVHATAVARQRGRTTWVWDCELKDDQDRLCALVRMTIAVRELR
jgi:uncharacterized protein (TIGR00369 family)